MPSASNAILYYEADQTAVAITALSDQGDNKDFRSTDTLWSARAGYLPVVTPQGIYDGGAAIPAVSGSNDVVDIAECRAYIDGVLTTISASVDEAIARPTATHIKYSVQVTDGGAFSVVAGTEHTSFSDVRAANGGPPYVVAGSSELFQVHLDSATPAPITAAEIKQVDGVSMERFDRPTWGVKYANVSSGILGYAGILFTSGLPLIHTGGTVKEVYASWYTPTFAEIIRAYDWAPPGRTITVNTTETYGETVGSVSRSLGAGTFTALLDDGISDNILRFENQNLWFKYLQNRLNTTKYQLAQGYLSVAQTNPAGDNISAAFTLGAEVVADNVYA